MVTIFAATDDENLFIIAFQYPPMSGRSGSRRSHKFVKYLPEHAWRPTVLSVHPPVYDRSDYRGLELIPHDVKIVRAFGVVAKKYLSIRSRYPAWLALRDRYVTWCMGAIPSGLRTIKKSNIDIIVTTYPIAVLFSFGTHYYCGHLGIVFFLSSSFLLQVLLAG